MLSGRETRNGEKIRRGRPVEIDRTAAALGAARAFWRYGYEGTSLDDLVAATKVSRPGLYRTFGDKEGLFLAALDAYEEGITGAAIQAFEAESDIAVAVEAFLSVSARNNTSQGAPSGCLIACCAATSAEEMPEVRRKIALSFIALENRIAERFAYETENGVLSASPSPETRARLLLDLMTAQAVRARSGQTLDALLAKHRSNRDAVLVSSPMLAHGDR